MELIFFIAFAGLILFIIFTRKGRRGFLQRTLGKIIKDYGDIDSSKINGLMNQTLHLYKCSKDGEEFFALEVRNSAVLAFNVSYIKISPEAAREMVKILADH